MASEQKGRSKIELTWRSAFRRQRSALDSSAIEEEEGGGGEDDEEEEDVDDDEDKEEEEEAGGGRGGEEEEERGQRRQYGAYAFTLGTYGYKHTLSKDVILINIRILYVTV